MYGFFAISAIRGLYSFETIQMLIAVNVWCIFLCLNVEIVPKIRRWQNREKKAQFKNKMLASKKWLWCYCANSICIINAVREFVDSTILGFCAINHINIRMLIINIHWMSVAAQRKRETSTIFGYLLIKMNEGPEQKETNMKYTGKTHTHVHIENVKRSTASDNITSQITDVSNIEDHK